MRILELIPTLKVGGAEAFVVNLANAFVADNHECKVVTLFNADTDDISAQRLDKKVQQASLGKSYGFDFKCFYNVLRLIRKDRPDIVHVHIGAITYVLLAAIFYRRCKYVATIHSEASREAGGLITRTIRKFLFKSKLVHPVAISLESMLSFKNFYSMDPKVIYNGVPDVITVDFQEYEKNVFVHPASCQPVKNQMLLFKAFQKISEKYANVELHWYGSHSQYGILFDELNCFLGDKIIYKGVTKDIRRYLKNARAMCLSSTMEGMPMTIIEAMSVGCIPITTPVGGCLDMINDGENGFLSADMSVEAYVEVLERVLKISSSDLNKMKAAARNTYDCNFTIGRTAHEYITLFTDC